MSKISKVCADSVRVVNIIGHESWLMDTLSVAAASVASLTIVLGRLRAWAKPPSGDSLITLSWACHLTAFAFMLWQAHQLLKDFIE